METESLLPTYYHQVNTFFHNVPARSNAQGEYFEKQKKWVKDDYICCDIILNVMANELFDEFHKYCTNYELWMTLEQRYDNEELDTILS